MAFAGDDGEYVGVDLRSAIRCARVAASDLVRASFDPCTWVFRLVSFGPACARSWLVSFYADRDHTMRAFPTA